MNIKFVLGIIIAPSCLVALIGMHMGYHWAPEEVGGLVVGLICGSILLTDGLDKMISGE